MITHATRSPSGAHRWSICTASAAEEAGMPDSSSDAADWGTAAHLVSSTCLSRGEDASQYLGAEVFFTDQGETLSFTDAKIDKTIPIDAEMVACVHSYVTRVRELVEQTQGTLLVEQRVPVDHITGEQGAGGTADAIILAGDTIIVIDLKSGRDPVYVRRQDGRMNLQLAMYVSGAVEKFGLVHDFTKATGIIMQPTIGREAEHTVTIDELHAEIEVLRAACTADPVHVASSETCKYCRAFPCAAATMTAAEAFEDLDAPRRVADKDLGEIFGKLDFVEEWADGIRKRVREHLEQGKPVQGWKLVEGKLGARQWTNADAAEEMLTKQFRVDAYEKKLISPTKVEALAEEKVIGPRQWKKLQPLIVQARNKPSIVSESDPRPAFAQSVDGLPHLDLI